MTTESERILARYKQVEREPDALGRVIGVHRLKPSEQTKIFGMTPDLVGAEDVDEVDKDGQPTGNKIPVSHRVPLMIAASVCEIDGVMLPFPRSRGELDWIYDKLDAEGLAAASTAFARLFPKAEPGEPNPDPQATAKN